MGLHATTKQTLTWLAAWPWLSSAQLAILLDQAGETVQRRLCRAVEQGEAQALVQFRPALPNETLYALTDAGIVQLARAVGVQPRALARRYDLSPQTSYAVLNDQDHVYRVRSLILGLVQLARQRGDQVTTGRTWPQVPFKRGSRNRTFGADAYVVYQHGTGCYPFFLLYDRDGQPLEVLRNQVGLYLRYRESGDYPGSYYHFPALVAILTDQDRLVELRLRALALGQRWNMLAPRLILTTRAELEGTGQQPGLAGPIWRAGQAYDAASGIRLLQALHEAPVAQYRFQIPTPSLKAPQRELGERDFRPVHVLGVPVSARLQDRQRLKDLYRAINDTKAKPAPGVAVWEEYVALLNAALTPATQAVLDLVSRFGYLSAAHIAL
ncbi:MAG: replication-relaxation family protein, partial [Chloroflexi bacterium]|nr:replication-relaxation family protein [Chloroflexota bacterium]